MPSDLTTSQYFLYMIGLSIGNGGHMQLKLFKRLEPSPDGNSRVSAATSSESGKGDGREGPAAILYGDSCEIVAKKIR